MTVAGVRKEEAAGPQLRLQQISLIGVTLVLTDWSADGVLSFWSDKVLYALPINGDRKAVALTDRKYNVRGGRFSPDGRFSAYNSDEWGRFQVYSRLFSVTAVSSETVRPIPVSDDQAIGGVFWRQDSREIFFSCRAAAGDDGRRCHDVAGARRAKAASTFQDAGRGARPGSAEQRSDGRWAALRVPRAGPRSAIGFARECALT